MTGRRRVQHVEPPGLAVLVDGQELPVQPPEDLVGRWDLVVSHRLRGGGSAPAILKGSPAGPPAAPAGVEQLASVRVPRGAAAIFASNITSYSDPLAASGLPPYTGPDVRCPKCRQQGASTRFLSHGHCAHNTDLIVGWDPNERLHRECDTCGYAWDEATAAEQKPPAGTKEDRCP